MDLFSLTPVGMTYSSTSPPVTKAGIDTTLGEGTRICYEEMEHRGKIAASHLKLPQ